MWRFSRDDQLLPKRPKIKQEKHSAGRKDRAELVSRSAQRFVLVQLKSPPHKYGNVDSYLNVTYSRLPLSRPLSCLMGAAPFSWKFCSPFHFCWVLFHRNRGALGKKPRSFGEHRKDGELNKGCFILTSDINSPVSCLELCNITWKWLDCASRPPRPPLKESFSAPPGPQAVFPTSWTDSKSASKTNQK